MLCDHCDLRPATIHFYEGGAGQGRLMRLCAECAPASPAWPVESPLAALRRRLNEAVSSEDFESAARLRDELRALERPKSAV
jgi:protein-arginine kinase activator protein McsA